MKLYLIALLPITLPQLCSPIMPGNTTCDHPENQGRYIEEFTCSNDSTQRLLKEMRLSFPSGHSSFSAYTLIYLAVSIPCPLTSELLMTVT